MLFDDHALYFGFTCFESKMGDLVAGEPKRDASMDGADHVQIFLGPTHDRFNFFQFAVNAAGARLDASGDGAGVSPDWDGTWRAAVKRGPDRWCAEVAIPFACLGISNKVGHTWDMNLCRVERPHGERSSWSPAGSRFRTPTTFGTLTGLDVDFSHYCVSFGPLGSIATAFGANNSTVRLANTGSQPRSLRCRVTVHSPSEKPRTTSARPVTLAAGTHATVELAYQIFEPGAHRLVFEATEPKTDSPVAAFERNMDLSAPVEHSLFHSYYRDDVSVRSRLNLSQDELRASHLTAILKLGEDTVCRRTLTAPRREAEIRLDAPNLQPGTYVVHVAIESRGKTVHEQKLEFSHLRQKPITSLLVYPRDDLTLMVQGQPFFPLGIYEAPVTQKMLDEFTAAGFNTVRAHAGSAIALKLILDRLDQVGLKAWVSWGHGLELSENAEKRKQRLRDVVARVREHPALLVWETVDEPAWGARSAGALLEGYEFLRQLDPHHPIWMNHAPRNHIATLAYYNRAADIAGCDIYPVPEPTNHTNLPNRTLSSVGDETDKNRSAVNDEKPIFMVLQGFAWRALRRRDDPQAVYPTFHQQRYMAYNAIVHGARGLLYWGTHYTPKPSQAWSDLKTIVHELRQLTAILVARAPKTSLQVTSDTGSVEALVRQVGDETFLVCVNNESRAANASVANLPKGLRVLYEPGRRLDVRAGRTELSLPGYGVVVATTDDSFDDSRPDYSAEARHAPPVPSIEAMREPGNLVTNPSFEFDPTGTRLPDQWTCRYPFSAVLTADRPKSGKRCLQFTSPDPQFTPLLVQTSIAVEANREYELSAWFRTDRGAIECRVYVEWVIEGKFFPKVTPWTKGTGEWQHLKRGFKASPPPGTGLYVVVQAKGKGAAWFDDVRLTAIGH